MSARDSRRSSPATRANLFPRLPQPARDNRAGRPADDVHRRVLAVLSDQRAPAGSVCANESLRAGRCRCHSGWKFDPRERRRGGRRVDRPRHAHTREGDSRTGRLDILRRFATLERSRFRCSAGLPPSLKLRRTAEALAEAGQARTHDGPNGSHYTDVRTGLGPCAAELMSRHETRKHRRDRGGRDHPRITGLRGLMRRPAAGREAAGSEREADGVNASPKPCRGLHSHRPPSRPRAAAPRSRTSIHLDQVRMIWGRRQCRNPRNPRNPRIDRPSAWQE